MNSVPKLRNELALVLLLLHCSLTRGATVATGYGDDDYKDEIITEDPFPWKSSLPSEIPWPWDKTTTEYDPWKPITWDRWTWNPKPWTTYRPYTYDPWTPDGSSSDSSTMLLAIFIPVIVVVVIVLIICKSGGCKDCSESSTYTSGATVHAPPRQRPTPAAPPRQYPNPTAPPGVHRNTTPPNQSETRIPPSPRTLRMMFATDNSQNNIFGGLGNENNSSPNDNQVPPFDSPPDYSTVIISDGSNFPAVRPEKTMDSPPPLYDEHKLQRF